MSNNTTNTIELWTVVAVIIVVKFVLPVQVHCYSTSSNTPEVNTIWVSVVILWMMNVEIVGLSGC